MQSVTVSKSELLRKVRENRETHIREYVEADEGWIEEVEKALVEMLEKFRSGDFSTTNRRAAYDLPRPKSHVDEYDTAIAMLEMSVDAEVELMEHEFQQYVMDEWHWTRDFKLSNSAYNGGR